MRALLLLMSAVLLAVSGAPARAALAPPNAAGLTFGHVHINVTDVAAHNRFWSQYFGGAPFRHRSQAGVKFPGLLLLMNVQAPTAPSQGAAMDHFGFKVPSLEATSAALKAAGFEVSTPFTGMEGFPNAYAVGPDGVRVEMQEDKTLNRAAVAHHVHFIIPDNEPLLAWYIDTFGLERFARGRLLTTANAPGMNLSFGVARAPAAPTAGRAIDHIGFEFKDLAAEVRALQARGVKLDGLITRARGTGVKSAFLTDPAGVRIELTQGLAAY